MEKYLKEEHLFPDIQREIQQGEKQSHWMWFTFPQIQGLGQSPTAQYYSLKNVAEAQTFANHPILGKNLRILCEDLLHLSEKEPENIFGYIDAMKLKSSMTLFYVATQEQLFLDVLNHFYQGQQDQKTLTILKELAP